jgi:hemoglobin-like flavoprotein
MDVPLLQRTFQAAVDGNPNLVHDFYFEHLFRDHPELHGGPGALFPADMQDQMAKLSQTLAQALEHLGDSIWLQVNLTDLGRKHAAYRVQPYMFEWVGSALLATLRESVPGWDARVEAEWAAVYAVMREIMLSGYPEATTAEV